MGVGRTCESEENTRQGNPKCYRKLEHRPRGVPDQYDVPGSAAQLVDTGTVLGSGSSKNHVWRGVRTQCSVPFHGADSPHLLYLPWASIQMHLLLQGLAQAGGRKGTRKAQGRWEN